MKPTKDFDSIFESFNQRSESLISLIDLDKDIVDHALDILTGIQNDPAITSSYLITKLKNAYKTIGNIKDTPSLVERNNVLLLQTVVLLVSNFEKYFKDLFKLILDKNPSLLRFKEVKIDLSLLENPQLSLEDIIFEKVMANGQISFQDLKSTKRFLRENLKLDLQLDEITQQDQNIIEAQALRHLIIHQDATVDQQFLTQLKIADIKKDYRVKEKVVISKEQIKDFNQAMLDLVTFINTQISVLVV